MVAFLDFAVSRTMQADKQLRMGDMLLGHWPGGGYLRPVFPEYQLVSVQYKPFVILKFAPLTAYDRH